MPRKLFAALILGAVAVLLCAGPQPAAFAAPASGGHGMGAHSDRAPDVGGWLPTGETFSPALRATALPAPAMSSSPATLAAESALSAFAAVNARPRGDGREPVRPAYFRITARSHAP